MSKDNNDIHGNMWGYKDSKFVVSDPNNEMVTLAGDRYAIAGKKIPNLFSYMRNTYSQEIGVDKTRPFVDKGNPVNSRLDKNHIEYIQNRYGVNFLSVEYIDRINCSHGHSLEEIYLRNYYPKDITLVDAVFFPEKEDDIISFVEYARQENIGLVPFGGGTNTSKALVLPSDVNKPVVVVSLKKMNGIIEIDLKRRQITVEAGVTGKQLLNSLGEQGYTVGHEPDSLEFSTVGGWIATLSSGMKKNRYGNIEDIVLSCSLVTDEGIIEKGTSFSRESAGMDLSKLAFGSEGNLGIISKATLKIRKLPEVNEYQSYFFKNFEQGLEFMEALSEYDSYPASVRLMDNRHLQLGLAVKPSSNAEADNALPELLASKSFELDKVASCTIVFEGFEDEVNYQKSLVSRLGEKYSALETGSEAGSSGYQMTFAIAYIRDFFLSYGIFGESMEATISWDKVTTLYQRMTEEVEEKAQSYGMEKPVLMYRVSQIYHTEALVYFYFVQYAGDEKQAKLYFELQSMLRHLIVQLGGSFSHHHGIGKMKTKMLNKIYPDQYLNMLKRTKKVFDQDNRFCINNAGICDEL